MSQIAEIAPHRMGRDAGAAAAVVRPATPSSFRDMSDGDLADELRGQRFAKDRAEARMAAIAAELDRRGLATATGKLGCATRREDPLGRVDLKRLRTERPEICRAYALPGSSAWWSVRTLGSDERAKGTPV